VLEKNKFAIVRLDTNFVYSLLTVVANVFNESYRLTGRQWPTLRFAIRFTVYVRYSQF